MNELIEGEQYLALSCETWHLVVCRGGRLGFDSADKAGFHALNDVKQHHKLSDVLNAVEAI